jgi:hypothetical protein
MNLKPQWNPNRRELTVDGNVIKRFRQRRGNQERLVIGLHEASWPEHIDDPLPYDPRIDPKRRLRDTVHSLNIRQHTKGVLRFEMDGTGEGILWEVRKSV